MNHDEAKALEAFHRGVDADAPARSNEGVTIREHAVAPAGKRRHDETAAQNVAQKFAQAKEADTQALPGLPSLLWIDVQDEAWWTVGPGDVESVRHTFRNEFYSGGLWHAFLARKGTPIFEGQATERRGWSLVETMGHDGRFFQTRAAAWAGVVLALHSATVILENPFASTPLPLALREALFGLHRFDLGRSWLDWPPGARPLLQRLDDEHLRLLHLGARARFSW